MIFRPPGAVWNAADSEVGGGGTAMTARWGRTLLACAVLGAASGCGFLQDLAEPDEPLSIPVAEGPAPVTETPDDRPFVVVEGDLLTSSGGRAGRLTVTVGAVETGLVPPVPNFSDSCPVEATSLQYVPVDFGFTTTGTGAQPGPGLAARVDVGTGPDTPADIGDVGVVVESGDGTERYCFDYPPLPTSDRFWNQMGAATVAGYVVLDEAVSAGTPGGRAEVFPTLRLRISELRLFSDPEQVRTLEVGDLSVGAPCPDDPEAICVPLG
jgi:hypothetical protein